MRPGESDGQDYFFVSKQEFHKWLEQGDLLEHAMVYGEYKGIPRSQVEQALERGSDVVLRVDVQGAETIRQILPHSVSIFLVSKSKCCVIYDQSAVTGCKVPSRSFTPMCPGCRFRG